MRFCSNRSGNVLRAWLATALVMLAARALDAREWSTPDGRYKIGGELIAFSDQLVVIKKVTGELVGVELKDLSQADRDFVQSKEAEDTVRKSAEELQTWTTKDGVKVRGRVTAFGRKPLQLQRKLGQVYVDGSRFTSIDPLHQRVILKIVSHLEKTELTDEKQLTEWAKTLGAQPRTYTLEGVLLQLESGDEIGVPFFLFSPQDLQVLKPGWEVWLEQAESEETRKREDFLMRSQAMAYQQQQAQWQQMEMLKLDLLATATGVVSIWEVAMGPGPGMFGRPICVAVPARTSEQAAFVARMRYPGLIVGGVRKLSY